MIDWISVNLWCQLSGPMDMDMDMGVDMDMDMDMDAINHMGV
jgi:hypothetical protein